MVPFSGSFGEESSDEHAPANSDAQISAVRAAVRRNFIGRHSLPKVSAVKKKPAEPRRRGPFEMCWEKNYLRLRAAAIAAASAPKRAAAAAGSGTIVSWSVLPFHARDALSPNIA